MRLSGWSILRRPRKLVITEMSSSFCLRLIQAFWNETATLAESQLRKTPGAHAASAASKLGRSDDDKPIVNMAQLLMSDSASAACIRLEHCASGRSTAKTGLSRVLQVCRLRRGIVNESEACARNGGTFAVPRGLPLSLVVSVGRDNHSCRHRRASPAT
jgi:hypothetical protein